MQRPNFLSKIYLFFKFVFQFVVFISEQNICIQKQFVL
jgi:hypothetical protein